MGPPCPRYSFLHIMLNTFPLDLCRMLHVPCFPLMWTMDGFLRLGFPRPSSRVFRLFLRMPCFLSSMLCAFDMVLPRLAWVVDCASVCVDGWDCCLKTLDSWEGSDHVEAEGPRRHTANGPLEPSVIPVGGRHGVGSIPTRTAEVLLGHHRRGGHDRCRSTFPSRGLRRRPFQPLQSSDPDPFLFLPFERETQVGFDGTIQAHVSCPAVRRTQRCARARHGHRRCVACVPRAEERSGKDEKATRGRGHGAWLRVGTRRTGSTAGDGTRSDPWWLVHHRLDPWEIRRTIRVQSKQKPGSIEERTQVERNGAGAGEGPHFVQWMMCVCDHACATTMEKSCNELHSSSEELGTSNPMGDCKCDGENA